MIAIFTAFDVSVTLPPDDVEDCWLEADWRHQSGLLVCREAGVTDGRPLQALAPGLFSPPMNGSTYKVVTRSRVERRDIG